MIRCPYCGSHNVIQLPLGDYLCLDCEERFSKGERPPRNYRKLTKKALAVLIKRSPEVITKLGGKALPAILKGASVFF